MFKIIDWIVEVSLAICLLILAISGTSIVVGLAYSFLTHVVLK